MKKILLLATLFLCSTAVFSQKKIPQKIAASISQLESTRCRAMEEGDLIRLEACLDESLLFTHTNGLSEDKSGFLEAIRSGKYKFRAYQVFPETYRYAKKQCVVHGRSHIEVFAYGKEYNINARYTAVYQRGKGHKWRLAAWQNTKLAE